MALPRFFFSSERPFPFLSSLPAACASTAACGPTTTPPTTCGIIEGARACSGAGRNCWLAVAATGASASSPRQAATKALVVSLSAFSASTPFLALSLVSRARLFLAHTL